MAYSGRGASLSNVGRSRPLTVQPFFCRTLDFQEDDLDLGLKDRVAIVTGGSRGIGKACAAELLAEGASVVLVSKNAEANAAAVRELGQRHPDRVLGVPTDLADDAGVAAMTARAVDRYGRIDILVNSAATVIPQD